MQNNSTAERIPGSLDPACSAACPDFWIRYEMKDGEEVLNMSSNVISIALPETFKAIETIKAKMTTGNGASPKDQAEARRE